MNPEKLRKIAEMARQETRHLDFKENFDIGSAGDWAKIIKDIIAFANSDGGTLIFGLKDNGFPVKFNHKSVLNLDPATIADKISTYTGEDFADFEITTISRRGRKFSAFIVSLAPVPIVFRRAGADIIERGKQKPAFAKGSVYFRHGAKIEPGTTNDIRNAINRVLNHTRREWLQGVRRIANIEPGDEVIVKRIESSSLDTSRIDKAPGRIVSDKTAKSFRPENPEELWPFRAKELLVDINKKITGRQVKFPDILYVKFQYRIDEKKYPNYVWKPYRDVSPRYSKDFAHWILERYKKDPAFFEKAKRYHKKSKPTPRPRRVS